MNTRRRTRLAVALTAVTTATLLAAVYAFAGHQPTTVPSFTGCVALDTGKLVKLKPGDAPKSACGAGETEAHLSGGDITGVTAGAGLLFGDTEGSALLRADPAVVQFRVTGLCFDAPPPAGDQAIRQINQDGTVVCNVDDVGFTKYTLVAAQTTTNSDFRKEAKVQCPSGTRVLAGGASYLGQQTQVITVSRPLFPVEGEGWFVSAVEYPSHPYGWLLRVTAICADVQ